jgi:membrane protein
VKWGFLEPSSLTLINFGKWLILLSFLFFGISTLFQFGPAQKTDWQFFSPGAILATFFIVITSIGFGYYIENFSQYNKLYGSIGTLIIVLLWLYFNAIVMLIGFELNTSIFKAIKTEK